MSKVLLDVKNLGRSFSQGGETIEIFKDLNMQIAEGEMVALVGPSGAGKSTLLHLIGLLDKPTKGEIFVDGHEAGKLNDLERTKLRRDFIGFVYQFHYLQPEFSALENVVLPQMIKGRSKSDANEFGKQLLETLGLGHRVSHRPARLSGGEQQRVAIARALANRPKLLLTDEPTGNLDPDTSEEVFEMLVDLVRGTGIGALIATHNMDLAARMDRILFLKNGKVSEV
ncbi:MAG TPA: ABC transporter ATP-binding protein [Porticoccaceae bacterium]|nr:ABC transporter ATP-binding protein [Pseudomonadota bacterium]HIF26820.1 ABC transporter ATP-binding protein [Micavibrio sp.]HIK79302.1 ABC transporter ATP-binding protein [Porticoccaceae bacterium]